MALRTDVTALARRQHARKPHKVEEAVTALGVVAPPPIQVESPYFTGSLGTLFTCVRERKVDLLTVPLLPICEAYFLYLLEATLKDLDNAGAALAALSYLLERKAWSLLPVAEPVAELELPTELIAPTNHEYETAITSLNIWQDERERMFFRPPDCGPDPYELPFEIGNVTINDLARAFEKLLTKATVEGVKPLNRPRRSISEQMKVVLKALSQDFKSLDQLITLPFSREEAVYWFLSLLELIRLGQVNVRLTEAADVEFAKAA
ncbi:MAG TPA: segregation/condensation protein A [Fimbriimonadaceae bacterium]|jgi:chromatin segregation and condensation protein Rec8/ScpA/Scc1 (kleisin family)